MEGYTTFKISDKYHKNLGNYLSVINYTDRALAQLFDRLKERNELDNTIVIITGDHPAFWDKTFVDLRKVESTQEIIPKNDYGFTPLIIFNY